LSNLENLTNKIVADGKQKAGGIVQNAKNEADEILKKAENEAKAESAKALAAAEEEAKKLIELAVSAKKIEIRDRALAAKQSTIKKALDEAKKRLASMDLGAFEEFVLKTLKETPYSEGETLRVPEAYSGLDAGRLNAKLTASGKPALTLDKSVFTENGFKLVKNEVQNDNSFDALIDFYRESLEQTVVEALFNG
jgi:V/A-type H+-transporting ATPase subunit E